MIAVIKITLTLILVISLLHKKFNFGNAMLAGAILLFGLCSPQLKTLEDAVSGLLFNMTTWEILFALYLVMCLEYQLRTSGIIDGFMNSSRALLKSEKILLVLMPAFLGFLPSLGGARFSAPLVESAAKPYNITPEKKAAINYWFRHIWECTNPIIPSLLLASSIAKVPVGALIGGMLWVSALCLIMGWFYYITPLRSDSKPSISAASTSGRKTNYRFIVMAISPIIANFLLVVGFNLSPAVSMLIVVLTMSVILRHSLKKVAAMLKHAFDRKLLWGITGILFFQHMLHQTNVIGDVVVMLQSLHVSILLVIPVIGFIAGLLTGSSQGTVAITFPFVAAISTGNVDMAVLAFVAGFTGMILSPTHFCMVVSLDYFKADYFRAVRNIAILDGFLLIGLLIKTIYYF